MDKFEDAAGFIVRGAAVVGSAIIAGATLGTALALGGLAIGVRLLGSAIQGRPSRVQAQQANYDPTATCKVVYGRTWVGLTGADIWVDHDDVSDHESLWAFGVFSVGSENGQGVEDVEKIKLDGILAIDPVTTGGQVNVETGRTSYYAEDDLLSYNVRLGTDAQGVNTDAQGAANNASDRYPDSFRFRGLCYAAFNMWKHKDVFPNFPRSISARVKGVRVYDPRNPTDGPDDDGFIWDAADTTASLNQNPGQNPALLLLDYLTSKRYGDAAFYPERDGGDTSLSEIDEQSFIDAANHCDELVQDGEGGTQPRYSFNDWIDTGNSLEQNTAAILSSMRGILHYQEGRYRLVIPQVQSSVMTLSEEDIIGDWTLRRRGASEVPNRVVAQIPAREGETTGEVQFPGESDTTFLDQDGGVPQVRTVQLYGVDDPVRAEQLAMISLRESREDAGVSFRATERAAALEVGDVFTLDHAFPGWQGASAKEFRVLDLTHRPDFTVEVTAQEYAASAYSLDSQTRPTPPPGSDLPDPTSTNPPTNLQLTSDATTQQVTPAGDKVPGILATWDLPLNKGIDRVVVLEREDGTSSWNTADVVDPSEEQRSLFRPNGGEEGETWEVGVYVLVGQRLLKSSVTTATVPLDTDFVPGDPNADFVPRVQFVPADGGRNFDPSKLPVKIDATPGRDSDNPDLEVDWRLFEEGVLIQDWSGFASAPIQPDVPRFALRRRTLVAKARDASIPQAPESPQQSMPIPSSFDIPNIPGPGGPRGPVDEERHRSGYGGETPGRETIRSEVRDRQNRTPLIDPATGRMGTGLFGPTGLRGAADIEDGADRGMVGLTGLGNVDLSTLIGGDSGLDADRVNRQTGEGPQNLLGRTAAVEDNHTGTAEVPGAGGGSGVQDHHTLVLSDVELAVGDVVSAGCPLKSDTGADRLRLQLQYRDASGTQVDRDSGNVVQTAAFGERSVVEDSEIPPGTHDVRFLIQNLDGTEDFQSRRRMLNRGPVAQEFNEPPIRGRRETGADLRRSSGGATLAQVLRFLSDDGHIKEDARQVTGGELRQIARGIYMGQVADGVTVDFTQAIPGGFDQTPVVWFLPNLQVAYEPGDGSGNFGSDRRQWGVRKAVNLDDQGFDAVCEMQDRDAASDEQDDFPAGTLTQNGDALSLAGRTEGETGGDGLTDEAGGDSYEVFYSGSVTADDPGSGGQSLDDFEQTSTSVFATIHVDEWSDEDADWIEADQQTHGVFASNGAENTNQFSDSIQFSSSQLDSDEDIRVRLTISVSGDGTGSASVDPDRVEYAVFTLVAATQSPAGEKHTFLAMEGT